MLDESLPETAPDHRVFIDMLGGDTAPRTTTESYEGDAQPRNLSALKEWLKRDYARLVRNNIKLVLFGRQDEIEKVVNGVHKDTLPVNKRRPVIEVVDCAEQTPMGAKRAKKGTSMDLMFARAKEESPDLLYTAGSTAAEVIGAAKFRKEDRGLGAPFIEKELLPGVMFGDNGALPKLKLDQYGMMDRVLAEESEKESYDRRVMILPSDDFSEEEIQDYLKEHRGVENFLAFDPLAEIGFADEGGQPDTVLADGFIGNLHLKFVELLYRERLGLWHLAKNNERQAIRDQVQPLVKIKTEKGFDWSVPKELLEAPRVGVLCNGGEDTKGTLELKEMMKKLDSKRFFYVEPKDLLADPNLPIVATPASKVLVDTFFDKSFLKTILRHPVRAKKAKAARKEVPAMAEIVNLQPGSPRIMAAHGRAEVSDTVQNLSSLVDLLIEER